MKIIAVSNEYELDLLKTVAIRHTFIEQDFDCTKDYYISYLDKIYKNPLAVMLLAIDDDKPIGYLIAYKDSSGLRNEGRSFDIFILPAYQNQGLLKLFMKYLTVWAVRIKVDKFYFSSQVLQKHTFQKYSPIPVYDSPYNEYYVNLKELKKSGGK